MAIDSVSIVIPVYNSSDTLEELVRRLEPVLASCAAQAEVVLVNDDSSDHSWKVITRLIQDYPWVQGIDLMRNYGQHNALLAGIRIAQYSVIITMDDDLQHPPEEIPNLLAKLAEGYDVVYGTPREQKHSLWRILASTFLRLSLRGVLGINLARHVSAFRAFRVDLRDAFRNYESPHVFLDVLLSWGTTRYGIVEVAHSPRRYGHSNYSFMKLTIQAINMLLGFSTLPLRLASILGFGFMLLGLLVLTFVLGRYLIIGYSIPGFPFLASTIAVFSGAQLFALGIIGEYLAHVHTRTMGRPAYVIRPGVGERESREQS